MSSEEESKKRKADELDREEGAGEAGPSSQGHAEGKASTDRNKLDESAEKDENGDSNDSMDVDQDEEKAAGSTPKDSKSTEKPTGDDSEAVKGSNTDGDNKKDTKLGIETLPQKLEKEASTKEPTNKSTNPYENLKWIIVKNDGRPESLIKLVALKSLFAKQLPKMPRAYIARLVFDRRHISLVILSDDPALKDTDEEVIGSICYRPFPEMRFAEIAFCAVNATHQVKVSHCIFFDWKYRVDSILITL